MTAAKWAVYGARYKDLIGRYVRVDNPGGVGGAGLVVEVDGHELIFDYGMSVEVLNGAAVTVTEPE